MPARRRTGLWVIGVLGFAAVAAVVVATSPRKGSRPEPGAARAIDETTSMPALTAALRESDARALAVLFQKVAAKPETPAAAVPEAETAAWVEALKGVRTGFPKFGTYGRASALSVVGRFFLRLGADPAPAGWGEALAPAHDIISAGLNDASLDVRTQALAEVAGLWSWIPARTLLSAEENALGVWKEGFYGTVLRRLGDPEPKARAAAVACLGHLPIDAAAAPAIAYLDDPKSPEVRKQVLVSFATRPTLLTEDAVLKHVYDKEAGIPDAAELVLKSRGLNQEQISLGSMIFSPKADIRASVITLIRKRTDIDPTVWLIQLSRDGEETVRLGAIDALADRLSPEGGRRLAEMAATDSSEAVRRAASKHLPAVEKTAALPPLPGSPSLNPKAN